MFTLSVYGLLPIHYYKRIVCDSAGVIYEGLVLSELIGQIERRLS